MVVPDKRPCSARGIPKPLNALLNEVSFLSTPPERRRALVFSGGSLKGAAFIGALQALQEAGASFDMFGGSSAGSIAAVLAGSGMPLRDIEGVVDEIAHARPSRFRDYNVRGLLSLLTLSPKNYLGLLHGDKLERELGSILDRRGITHFSDLAADTYVVTVNALDGRELVCTNMPRMELDAIRHTQDLPVAEALRASTAIPGVFVPKFIGEGVFVDGGVRSYLPLLTAAKLGAQDILGITFTQSAEDRERVLAGGVTSLLARTVDLLIWDQLESDLALLQEQDARPVVMTLDVKDPKLFNLDQIPALVQAGYEQTVLQLEADPDMIAAFV